MINTLGPLLWVVLPLHAWTGVHLTRNPSRAVTVQLTTDDSAKIGDFGLCRRLNASETGLSTAEGFSLQYAAPEVLTGQKFSRPADVYSYSMVLYQIFTLREPYDDQRVTAAQVLLSATYYRRMHWQG